MLNDLDPHNETCGFRIALAGPHLYGRGPGTEVTRLVVGYALLWDGVRFDVLDMGLLRTDPRP